MKSKLSLNLFFSLMGATLLLYGSVQQGYAEAAVTDINTDSNASSLEQRTTRLENMAANQAQLTTQINNLQQQVQDLRGQVEVLTNENQQLKQQQLKFFTDLDQRLSAIEKPPVSSTAATPVPTTAHIAAPTAAAAGQPLNETDAYQAAFTSIKAKQYPQAIKQLQSFLQRYPNSDYAPNAHYWLGEIYLVQTQADEAKKQFKILINDYPQNAKVPDAMLKLAFIDIDQGHKDSAIAQLKKIQKLYPGTTAANLAKAKLQSFKK